MFKIRNTLLCLCLSTLLFPTALNAQVGEAGVQPKATLIGVDKLPESATPEDKFCAYSNQLKEVDVYLKKPEGYKSIPMDAQCRLFFFTSIANPSAYYQIGLQSSDGKAMMLFPMVLMNFGVQSLQQGRDIESDLRIYNSDRNLDINPMIEVISNKDMSRFANADTAVIYSFELSEPYVPFMERYNHCVGVYLRKYGHPALLLKLVLDDEGYKDKDAYLSELLSSVRYGDNETWLTPFEKEIKTPDLSFPSGENYQRLSPNYKFGVPEELRKRWKAENDSLNSLQY